VGGGGGRLDEKVGVGEGGMIIFFILNPK